MKPHEVTCPECRHVFTPARVIDVDIEHTESGPIVRINLAVGFGQAPMVETLHLSPLRIANIEEKDEIGNIIHRSEEHAHLWTDVEIKNEVQAHLRQRIEELE